MLKYNPIITFSMKNDDILFPHDEIRPTQDEFINGFIDSLKKKKHFIVHAPTGIGKTSVLGPALSYALKNNLSVFFLTSRHTQHQLAVETLRMIKKKHNVDFLSTNIIGKRWMCCYEGIQGLNSKDFNEFCTNMKDEGKCIYYENTYAKTKLSELSKNRINEINAIGPVESERIFDISNDSNLCAYEISIQLAKKSNIIITDYYYIFAPHIAPGFFKKTKKEIENSIIIIDEGHNLPDRLRELMSERLTTNMVARAIKEAKKHHFDNVIPHVVLIQDSLNRLSADINNGEAKKISKEQFVNLIEKENDYDELIADIEFAAESIRQKQQKSYLSGISRFLESWRNDDSGFSRIIKVDQFQTGPLTQLVFKCLDPSIIASPIIKNSYQTTLMSGTLSPTDTYKDLLGFPKNTNLLELRSPFPKHNRLNLIITNTTTKFRQRSNEQYQKIAKTSSEIANLIPGNVAVFFPSYYLRDIIFPSFKKYYNKKIFLEDQKSTKEEKNNLLNKFKKQKDKGSCLLAVSAANFAEGIDLPGDFLKGVVVIGLPLQKPDLETKHLISYYDEKYGAGWDYGYVFPAFTKTLQTAGRCIRDMNDKGVIAFMDERYAWENYKSLFPKDWDLVISNNYGKLITDFFKNFN